MHRRSVLSFSKLPTVATLDQGAGETPTTVGQRVDAGGWRGSISASRALGNAGTDRGER